MNEVYTIERTLSEGVLLKCNGVLIAPDRSLKLRNHSPTGFEYGYGGSGPAQLALAILLNALPSEEAALDHYQEFKRDYVAGQSASFWAIEQRTIIAWYEKQVAKAREAAETQ